MRNKLLKKIGAIALAAAMTLGLATTAGAYSDGTQKGSITVHKFLSTSEGTQRGDGTEISDVSNFGTAASGVEFSLKKIPVPEGKDYTGDVSYEFKADGTVEYVVLEVNGEAPVRIHANHEEIKPIEIHTTNTNGIAVFGKGENGDSENTLEQGYYLLEETKGTAGYTPHSLPSLIAVPLTLADGSGHNWDIHVYPKNVKDSLITKTLNNNGELVNPGEDKKFSWTINATFDVNELRKGEGENIKYGFFAVRDYPSANLNILTGEGGTTVVVKTADKEIKLTIGAKPEEQVSGSYVDIVYTAPNFINGELDLPAVWELTPTGINKLMEQGITGTAVMSVNVVTTIDSFATNGTAAGIRNKADSIKKPANDSQEPGTQQPNPEPDPDPNPEPDPNNPNKPVTPDVTAPKANIAIEKKLSQAAMDYNEEQTDDYKKIKLDGIEFWLAKVANPKTSGENWKNDFVLGADGEPIKAITDADGNATFEGVPYDKHDGSIYYIIEVKTKEGLQLKKDSIKVELEAGHDEINDGVAKDYTVTAEITNYLTTEKDPDGPIFELPMTGGIGTTLFILIGAAIVGLGVLMVVKSKKKTA